MDCWLDEQFGSYPAQLKRSLHFVRVLLDESRRAAVTGNMVINSGSGHNGDIMQICADQASRLHGGPSPPSAGSGLGRTPDVPVPGAVSTMSATSQHGRSLRLLRIDADADARAARSTTGSVTR